MDDATRRTSVRAQRPPREPAGGNAGITGVATGSLGTGTALEETQVWDTAELQAAAEAAEAEAAEAEAARAAPAPAGGDEPAIAAASAHAPEPSPELEREPAAAASQPVPVEPLGANPVRAERVAASTQSPRPGPSLRAGPTPRMAGIAAAVVLALVAGAAVLGSFGGFGPGPAVPPAADQSTAAPTDEPAAEAEGEDDSDDDNGNKDKGNGKGNGRGRGND